MGCCVRIIGLPFRILWSWHLRFRAWSAAEVSVDSLQNSYIAGYIGDYIEIMENRMETIGIIGYIVGYIFWGLYWGYMGLSVVAAWYFGKHTGNDGTL